EREAFMQLAFEHPNLFIGVFDLKKPLPMASSGGEQLERAYAARLVQLQWEEVVNEVPMYSTKEDGNLEFLVPAVGDFLAPEGTNERRDTIVKTGSPWAPQPDTAAMRIHYFPPEKITEVKASAFLKAPEAH